MKWDPKLPKATGPKDEDWRTNDDVYAAWCRYVDNRGAKNTQRNLRVYVAVFVRMFEPMVTTLERVDMERFVETISGKCARLINGREPQCVGKRYDIAKCPIVTGVGEWTSCGGYRALDPVSVWSYICAVNRFYAWLQALGRVPANPMLGVMQDFASKHSAHFDERRRKPRRRVPVLEEIRSMIQVAPMQHQAPLVLLAKSFCRIHEVLKLRWHPDYCNLEEGWMDIPINLELGSKRKGNQRIILDGELRAFLKVYRVWWESRVRRDEAGEPVTDRVVLTGSGLPWADDFGVHNLNTALQRVAIDAGVMTGNETDRSQRINSHGFRAFCTTWARDHGASYADVQTLRGDLAPGSLERYDEYMRRLPDLYRLYGPVLGLDNLRAGDPA